MEPLDVEAPDETHDSAARNVFPKVSTTLPTYMMLDDEETGQCEGEAGQQYEAAISSGEE